MIDEKGNKMAKPDFVLWFDIGRKFSMEIVVVFILTAKGNNQFFYLLSREGSLSQFLPCNFLVH